MMTHRLGDFANWRPDFNTIEAFNKTTFSAREVIDEIYFKSSEGEGNFDR